MEPERAGNSLTTFPSKNWIYKQPYGVVCIIGAWNYPVQLTMMPLIGAISAGNTIVLKPSELAPQTSSTLAKLIREKFDPAFLTVLEGGVSETEILLEQPLDKIFFTGSTRVGKIIMKAAAENLTPVTLELGGKSPAIVHDDTNIAVSAKRIWWGKVINAGQTCIAPDYVAVHESVFEAFVVESKNVLSQFFRDDYLVGENYSGIINNDHFDRLIELLHQSKVIHGGSFNRDTRFIEPTLIEADWDDPIMDHEIFGPLLPIVTYHSTDHCIQQLRNKGNPLALYLFTEDSSFQDKILSRVPFGGGCFNETITHWSNHNLPIGGVGESGLGSYHGQFSFETFSRKQGVLKKGTWPDPDFRYPPYDSKLIKWLKRFIN
jgi:aldehyde dehydrogenase (NAD+)